MQLTAAGRDRESGMFERAPHVTGMMQDAPGIHHIELLELFHVATVEYVTGLDSPGVVPVSEVAGAQGARAFDGLGIVVKRVDLRTELSRHQRKQTTTTS